MHRLSNQAARLIVGATCAAVVPACSEDAAAPVPFVAIDQAPLTVGGLYSDDACGAPGCYGTAQQSSADNFVLSRSATLVEITIWGGYSPDNPPVVDDFTVIVHADAAGVPGAAVHTEAIAPVRTAPGGSFSGLTLYQYVFEFQTPPQLAAATYWVEIFNNTVGDASNFAWTRGTLDATNGVAGAISSETAPGVVWNHPDPTVNLAIRIDAR